MRPLLGFSLACVVALSGARAGAGTPPVVPTAPPSQPPPLFADPKLQLDLHGALSLWFYQPIKQLEDPNPGSKPPGPQDHFFEIYSASLEVSAKYDRFGVTMNPRFRDTKLRDFYPGNVWIQQAYASIEVPHTTIKLGKVEDQLSRQGDDSFYLNLLYFDGIKYAANVGLSVEGSFTVGGFGLGYAAQYALTDGRTNGSLRDRNTAWVEGAQRKHIGVVRLDPSYRFSKTVSLRMGAAAQASYVDLGGGSDGLLLRFDADVSLAAGPARMFGEGLIQLGTSATRYPYAPVPATGSTPAQAGRASARNYYGLAGAGVQLWRFYPRYSVSLARYADVDVTETVHVPGVTFTAHENLSLMFEYAYWPRRDRDRSWLLDSSANVVVSGKF